MTYKVSITFKGGGVTHIYVSQFKTKYTALELTGVEWSASGSDALRGVPHYINIAEVTSVVSRRLRWWEFW